MSDVTGDGHTAGGHRLGDYALHARLVRLDHADVYDAAHATTGAPRLIYVLRPRAMEDHALVHRVVCEVDAARWLRHPVTAKADGYGETPSRRLYVAVERAPGRTLREMLDAGERLAPWRVARLASRLVEALDEAHAVGLAHGRLTPESVVVAPDGDAAGTPTITLTGLGAGAVAYGAVGAADRPYVAPEQLAGADADARSDVFGLASLLHHLLLGDAPGEGAERPAPEGAPRPADVLAAARHPDPRRRPEGVKLLWEELLAAMVADAAQAPAPARPAADAMGAPPPAAFELDLLLEPALLTPPMPSRAIGAEPASYAVAAPAPAYAAPAPRPEPPRFERPLPPVLAREPELLVEAPPSVVPSRRRRALVTVFWCVAVPAVAAALSWPLGQDTSVPRLGEVEWEPDTSRVGPPLSPDAFRLSADSAAAARRDSTPAVPAMPRVVLPEVDLPTAAPAARVLVRPEEFGRRLAPDSGR